MVAKDHFSWCTFLNVWKHHLYAGDGFAVNRLGHAFHHSQNVFTNGALIPIYVACSFAETSEKLLLLRVFRTHAEHFQE